MTDRRRRLATVVPALAGLAMLAAGMGRARAGLLEVRQIAKGMECAECAHNLKVEVRKLDGVEEASASWNRRVLTVRFARGAKTTLAEVRAVLRRQHFVPGEAEIVVSGHIVRTPAGHPRLQLDGGAGARFALELGHLHLAPGTEEGWDGAVVVTGRVSGENPDNARDGTPQSGPRASDSLSLYVLDVKPAPSDGASP